MIAIPAIDIRGGRVVQLIGGDVDATRISIDDPCAVAEKWVAAGFNALHVVDLDAALGSGDNRAVIREIVNAATMPVQVGGGVRTEDDVAYWIEAGAARVIVGTRAVSDRAWLESVARTHPGHLIAAADVRDGMIATHGWQANSAIPVLEFIDSASSVPLGGILVTDIGREGRMTGADDTLFGALAARTTHPLIASGGIAGPGDLPRLAAAGVSAVVLGMALYTGALTPSDILEYAA